MSDGSMSGESSNDGSSNGGPSKGGLSKGGLSSGGALLLKRILSLALIPYAIWLVVAYRYHFIDGVNLLCHEAGHVIFGFLGQVMQFLGGTLGQLFFPIAFAVQFRRHGKTFEAAICGVWLAESLMYAAEYIGDAEAQVLPLVGGGIHDWHWLLSRAGILRHCEGIAGTVHVIASLLLLTCVALAFREAFLGRSRAAAKR
jgi:hypothetical protein